MDPAQPLIPVGDSAATKKRRKPMKCSTLTTNHYERLGWRPAFVERYVERPIPGQSFKYKVRFDAWGAFDHIVFHPENPIIRGVNSCRAADIAAHQTKMLANPRVYEWLASDPVNRRVDIIGWRRGSPGKKTEGIHRAVTLDMFVGGKPPEPEKKPRKAKHCEFGADVCNQCIPTRTKCRACGVVKTDQVAWSSDVGLCFVCAHTNDLPAETRVRQAEAINQGVTP